MEHIYHKIYKIFNIYTKEVCYVGITKNSLKDRFKDHCTNPKSAAYHYIQFYGISNFDIALIEVVLDDREKGFERESFWTKYYLQFYPLQNKVLGNSHSLDNPHITNFKEIKKLPNKQRPVVLLNNEQVFDSIECAVQTFRINEKILLEVCFGKRKQEHGRVWAFYDDYVKMSQDEIKDKIMTCHSRLGKDSIVCTTLGMIYGSIKEASKKTNVAGKDIEKCINKQCTYAGNYFDIKLKWEKANRFNITIESFKVFVLKQNDVPIFIGITRSFVNAKVIVTKLKNAKILSNAEDITIKVLAIKHDYQLALDVKNLLVKAYRKHFKLINFVSSDEMNNKLKILIKEETMSLTHKQVECITTGEIFESIMHAAKFYDLRIRSVAKCCFKMSDHAGVLEDGSLLKWKFTKKAVNILDKCNEKKLIVQERHYKWFVYQIIFNNNPIYIGMSNDKVLDIKKLYEKETPRFRTFIDNVGLENCFLQKVKYFSSKKDAQSYYVELVKRYKEKYLLFNNYATNSKDNEVAKKEISPSYQLYAITNDNIKQYIFVFVCDLNRNTLDKNFRTNLSVLKNEHANYFAKHKNFSYEKIDDTIYHNQNDLSKAESKLIHDLIEQGHYLFNTDKSKLNEKRIRDLIKEDLKQNRHVLCKELGLVFENLKIATWYMNARKTFLIGANIYNYKSYALQLSDGTKLHWEFTERDVNFYPQEKIDLTKLKKRTTKGEV